MNLGTCDKYLMSQPKCFHGEIKNCLVEKGVLSQSIAKSKVSGTLSDLPLI